MERGRPKGGFTQHRRLDRLRELLERRPKGMTLYELAGALQVTPRTLRRYLKEVEREYELEPVRVRGGGKVVWRITSVDIPRKVELRRTQALALLAARRVFEPMRGSALFDEIDMAVNKLMALARRPGRGPNAGNPDAQLEKRFLYLPFAPKIYEHRTEELDDLFQAVADLRPMTLLYRSKSRGKEETITIYPYALVLYRDAIYTVGYHCGRQEIRTFLLDRMRATECSTTERFELPADFDIDDYFQGELGIWRSEEKHRVVVEFDAEAAEYVRGRRVHPSQRLALIPGGGIRATMVVGNLTPVVSWILEWGPRARVIEPVELVDRVRDELSAALARYKPRDAGEKPPKRPTSLRDAN
ncbi:MAG TPA: WYL domain-containing protein [Polyangiaceae bacterium]|nr:WYL domain-containing protein [Polyangiaceae bacterium]